jgi:hypothetical protein
MARKVKPNPQRIQSSAKAQQPSKSSYLTTNNQKWNVLKSEIQRVYIAEDETLPMTMDTIEQSHGFKARSIFSTQRLKDILILSAVSAHGK